MSDLDELARAAQGSSRTSAPYKPPRRRTRISIPLIVALALVGLVAGGIVVWALISFAGSRGAVGTTPAWNPLGIRDAKPENPQFSISRRTSSASGTSLGAVWDVLNEAQSPLIVYRVRLNDEFDCPLASITGGYILGVDKEKSVPITLTIGETAHFLERYISDDSTYRKQVIFVDIDTNRGNFRQKDRGLVRR